MVAIRGSTYTLGGGGGIEPGQLSIFKPVLLLSEGGYFVLS